MANTKVTSGVIKDDAVGADQLASNSVVTASINDNAITTAKIADDAILTAKISNSAITNAKMSANSVDSDQYVDASIDTAHIRDAQITSAKLDTNISISGELTVGSHLNMGDGDILKIGAGADLQIYHDGSHSYIDEQVTGDLRIKSNSAIALLKSSDNADMLLAVPDGAVSLYYAGAKKLETASGGVTVTGTLTADDLEIDSGTLSVDASNNRVGIGNSPTEKLEVTGNIFINTSGNPNLTVKTSGAGNNPNIRIQADSNYWDLQTLFSNTNNELDFRYNGSSKMIINNSGNVGIGTENCVSRLSLGNPSADGTIDYTKGITFVDTLSSTSNAWVHAAIVTTGSTGYNGNLIFATDGDGNQDNDTSGLSERMRIDSSGNVGIGGSPTNYSDHKTLSLYGNTGTGAGFIEFNDTSGNADAVIFSDDGNLFINADYDNTASSSSIRFRVDGSSEKMRIDSSGNLLHGVQSTSAGFITDGGIILRQDNGHYMQIASGTTSDADLIVFYKKSGSGVTLLGSISSSGNNLVYGGQSDYRLKENIKPLKNGLQKLKKLNPVQFDWKETGGTNEGFIAHEVQDICKEAVSGEKDGEVMQRMDYGRITPILVKAIQEQQTIIDDLKSRIETLEG